MTEPKLRSTADLQNDKVKDFRRKTEPMRSERPEDPLIHHEYDNRPTGDLLGGGVFRTPFTGAFDTMVSMQGKVPCGTIELNMMECFEAYGLPRGNTKCRDYMDDFNECNSGYKQYQRIRLMRAERERQHRHGERKIKYAVPPRIGSFMY